MKYRAKRSSEGSSSGRGGRLRFAILLATVAAFMLVPAASAFGATNELVLTVEGSGSGEVSSAGGYEGTYEGSPAIECTWNGVTETQGGECEDHMTYEAGEEFEGTALFALPSAGSEFVEWRVEEGEGVGLCGIPGFEWEPGKFGPCVAGWETATEGGGAGPVEVVAVFTSAGPPPPVGPPLTTIIEEGTGTVVSNPAGIECTGEAPHPCSTEEIEEGQVTLTASPAPGYRFKSWKGCDKKDTPVSGDGVNGRQCTITLNGEKAVSAKFVKTWDVTLENGGGGKISTKPGGALCLPNCSETSAQFDAGKTVEVLAKANKHFHLASWGGDCSGSGACSISSISADHTVSATFAEDAKYALSIAKEGGGQALIKTKGPGTVCSYTCGSSTASFYTGEEVLVSWKLGKGTSSLTWTSGAGSCTGTHEGAEGSCTVTMSAANELVAELE